jgi:hypothetical protein
VGKPRVNFREAITRRADFDYLHKKQSGGWPWPAGQEDLCVCVVGQDKREGEASRVQVFLALLGWPGS